MKLARSFIYTIFIIFTAFSVFTFSLIVYFNAFSEKSFKVKKGDEIKVLEPLPISAEFSGNKQLSNPLQNDFSQKAEVELDLFGIIPIGSVDIEIVDELEVAILGTPFGMKIYTEGVLVIELTEVKTENGSVSPGKECGIKVGDYIISANGKKVASNEDLMSLVEASNGAEIKLNIKRNNKIFTKTLTPILSSETGTYKIGLWIRDSSAGIGTLTFYSPSNDVVCGLGHGICDEDTGSLLSIEKGEIVDAEIIDIKKAENGAVGQLKGAFTGKSIGEIDLNSELGVYSHLKEKIEFSELYEIALKNEISDGPAQILTTINGSAPQFFDCEIKVRTSNYRSITQNMIIKITDEALLEKTGGIVQGMSGSPIIQNGKLIGAVTHVLIDDCKRGYAIFAENMLETANEVSENQLKTAS